MKRTTASRLAAAAFDGSDEGGVTVPDDMHCAACGGHCGGIAHEFVAGKSFNDKSMFSRPGGNMVCSSCASLLVSTDATSSPTGSGVVSADGFQRLLSNRERLAFLATPPKPPFAVAIITAKRQHVWWMARVAYDRDTIPVQFGHRSLMIDRPRAIGAADAVLEYEAETTERDKKTTYVFVPLSRDLKLSQDGQYTHRFQIDQGNHAKSLKQQLSRLSLGDLWAMSQLRSAARELKAASVAAAVAELEAAKSETAPPDPIPITA